MKKHTINKRHNNNITKIYNYSISMRKQYVIN